MLTETSPTCDKESDTRQLVKFSRRHMLRLALICAVLFAACSSNTDSDSVQSSAVSAEDEAKSQAQLVEEEIARCMSALGFEYEVAVANVISTPSRDGLSRAGYAEAHGYGFTDVFLAFGEASPSAADLGRADVTSQMTRSEFDAWITALEGTGPEDTGCRGRAADEVASNLELKQLDSEVDWAMIAERVEGDPEIVEINTEWSRCMFRAGYDFASSREAQEAVIADVDSLYSKLDRFRKSEEGSAVNSDGSWVAGMPADLLEQTEAVREVEFAIASADVECFAPTVTRYQEIFNSYVEAARS